MPEIVPAHSPRVIALTERWLVLDKPPGWLSIPAAESTRPSLRQPRENALETQAPSPAGVLVEWARERYGALWVVHRLDRETSGVILLARTAQDHRAANTWFQTHQVRKRYDFLAQGIPSAPVMRIREPVREQPALTQVEVKESFREGFLGCAHPMTGRRHQIRLHLAGEGHPLWGDPLYRGPRQVALGKSPLLVRRVALHAARLELPGGERFEAPWPEDFAGWVERLRREGRRA